MTPPNDDGSSSQQTIPVQRGTPSFDATVTDPEASGSPVDSGSRHALRYRIEREHARGGLGIVFRAYDRQLNRTVAIKELQTAGSEAEVRFRREAEITARLEHPSIVPIHETGYWDSGRPFYAMKLVSGRPLSELLQESASLDARLAMVPNLLSVAEAIGYAHSLGVIHRDIKPSNILVGDYGETIVIDWGLAKELTGDGEGSADTPAAEAQAAAEHTAGTDLTRVGAVIGTPAYMPPEQARGENVDERADVYALGAALYQLLTGLAPYGGDSKEDVLSQVRSGPPAALNELASNVPHELAAICVKAMSRDPRSRYPTAAGFGDDLRRFLTGQLVRAHAYSPIERLTRWAKRRRGWLAVAGLLVFAGISGYALTRERTSLPSCTVDASALDGAWDPDLRQRVRASFLATGAPRASETFALIDTRLDSYAATWRTMREQACVDTHQRGIQPESVLELRTRCLDRRRNELAALTGLLTATPQDADLDQSVRAVLSLPSISACGDTDALAAVAPPPADDHTRARVEAARTDHAEIHALRRLGRIPEADRRSAQLVSDARAIGYMPLLAEALSLRAQLQTDLADGDGAESSLREAARAAAAAHDDVLVAHAWLDLVFLYGDTLGRLEQAKALLPVAEAAVARVQENIRVQGKLHTITGNLAYSLTDYTAAKQHLEAAVDTFSASPEGHELDLYDAVFSITKVYYLLRDYESARRTAERAIMLAKKWFGPDSPAYANALNDQAFLLNQQSKYADARALQEQALAVRIRALGPDDPQVAGDHSNLASTLTPLGELALARTHADRGVEILEARNEPPTNWLGFAYFVRANVLRNQGDMAGARKSFELGLNAIGATYGEKHPNFAFLLANLGLVANQEGKHAEALSLCERALSLVDVDGVYQFDVVETAQLCRAEALIAHRRPTDALVEFERLLKLVEPSHPPLRGFSLMADPRQRGAARFGAARALWDTNEDRARAEALSALAWADFVEGKETQRADQVAAWRRKRRLPSFDAGAR